MKITLKHELEIRLSKMVNSPYISYSKKRVSGSSLMTYIMHCRSKYMPGQQNLFTINSKTKPKEITNENMTRMRSAFKRERYSNEKNISNVKLTHNSRDLYTYKRFEPHSDDSLLIAINESYKQVFGNLLPMSSECPPEIQRRLRNGDISIREFIRELSKSDFYRHHFVESVSQKRCLELNFMHLLGRPLIEQKELQESIKLINEEGFTGHVDFLIDSLEYEEFFGEDIVPFPRFWNSPCGSTTSSFINTAKFRKGYATSDNVIY